MSAPIFTFLNYVDSTFASVAFSGGSWDATLSLPNLRDPLLSKVARSASASAAATVIEVDLGTSRQIDVVVIPRGHNFSASATIQITAAASAGFSTIIASVAAAEVWPTAYPSSTPWPGSSDSKVTAEDRAGGYPVPFIHIFASAVTARHWKITISDPNNADGYVDVPRLVMGPKFQPDIGMSYGAGIVWEPESIVQPSLGGARFYYERASRRVLRFSLDSLTHNEALVYFFEMQRRLGIHGQLFFIFDPDDTIHMHRRSFLCTMRQIGAIEYPFFNDNRIAFELEEVIA